MTQKSSFFNSINGDRKYNASDFADFFSSFIGNGVYPNPSTNLIVSAATGMNIKVAPGKAWINGYYYENTAELNLTIDVSDGVLKRIDRIVLKLDYLNRQIVLEVKKGTPASMPTTPEIIRNSDVYELVIADILINNGDTAINQANITDQRLNSSLCGIVHGTVEQVDTTEIFNQYQTSLLKFEQEKKAEFLAWIQELKVILDENTAGNLLNLINANSFDIQSLKNSATTHLSDYVRQPGYGVTSGSVNTYTLTLSPAPTAYVDGMGIVVKINVANTGASTINVNGLGAKAIVDSKGKALTSGKLRLNGTYSLKYNSTTGNFILQGSDSSGNATPADLLAGKTASTDAGDITGTIPSKGAATYNPSTAVQTIPAGQYLSGLQTIAAVTGTATAENVDSGKTFSSGSGINQVGTSTKRHWKTGKVTSTTSEYSGYYQCLVSGLLFKPKIVLWWADEVNSSYPGEGGFGVTDDSELPVMKYFDSYYDRTYTTKGFRGQGSSFYIRTESHANISFYNNSFIFYTGRLNASYNYIVIG
ncbi:hypothetical protein EHE19_019135 [Ruminiclostridium herbifermentans]|uniref:BppU N-terminal domain-containing protein n=1 Tax=Ruminiclostridium herbifermentans TaxID=2488810 RepID=A0A4U7J9E5_9FIRM|nr:hypothetical protein [Ruminiclostridium herbifermentans]QNU66912.1 hypothetical protein EHE19_019135 [Ruminiclostridium herbifermentans]